MPGIPGEGIKMKKVARIITAWVLVLVLCSGNVFCSFASAEETIYCPECGKKIAAKSKFCMFCGCSLQKFSLGIDKEESPGDKDIKALGDPISYPKSSNYLPDYEIMYVKSTKGHSINVYWKSQAKEEYKRPFYAYEADPVTVLARENGMSCVIFTIKNGIRHVGWVASSLLVYQY